MDQLQPYDAQEWCLPMGGWKVSLPRIC